MAIHAPITGAPLRARAINGIEPQFALANRKAIEREIERLITLLDAADGDCDLEDDDPAGDTLDLGEAPDPAGNELLSILPVYGIDQSLGPINEREAIREHYRQLHAGTR